MKQSGRNSRSWLRFPAWRFIWQNLPSPRNTKPAHYICAILSVVAAALITHITPFLHRQAPAGPRLTLFLTAVALTTWYGGMLPGLIATGFSMLVADYFLFPPTFSFQTNSEQGIHLFTFAFLAILMGSLHTAGLNKERSLRNVQQRLRTALESARMGAWDYNMLTDDFWWSDGLEAIFGRAPGVFSQTYEGFFSYIHPDDRDFFTHAITKTIQDGMDYEIEHRIVRPDQSLRWISTRGRVFYGKDGRADRIIGVAVDITDRKNREGTTNSMSSPTVDMRTNTSK